MIAVRQTLIGGFRHSAFQQNKTVNGFRKSIETVNLILCILSPLCNQIGIKDTFRIHDPIQLLYLIQLFLGPAIGIYQSQVEHILFIRIDLTCSHHI